MNLKQLAEPFLASDIEWRVQSSGTGDKGPWAKVLAYVTNRAIMERLDEVCGPENWQNKYEPWTTGSSGVMCGIAIKIGDVWVWKWDGAEQPKEKSEGQLVAVKGGFSMAMKRTGVQWGIGRYLYQLEEGWAVIGQNGAHYTAKNDKKQMPAFRWDPPKLPAWALPSDPAEKPAAAKATPVPPTKTLTERIDIKAEALARANATVVRGKTLAEYSTVELHTMQSKLRAEGKSQHKILLGSVSLVLDSRPPMTESERGEAVKAASDLVGSVPDGLAFV